MEVMESLPVEKKRQIHFSVFVGILCAYDILSLIDVLLVYVPLVDEKKELLWIAVAIDALCLGILFINFVWIRVTDESYYRESFEVSITIVAILVCIAAVGLGSFVTWADNPSDGPEYVHKILGFIFLTLWWYFVFSATPPEDFNRWYKYFVTLLLLGGFQAIFLSCSFIYHIQSESSKTVYQTGVAAYVVSVFENILLVEILHLVFESIMKTFQFEQHQLDSPPELIYNHQQIFTRQMILMVLLATLAWTDILIRLIGLILKDIYLNSHQLYILQVFQLCWVSLFVCVFLVTFLYLFVQLRSKNAIYFHGTHLMALFGTLFLVAVFYATFVLTNIWDYQIGHTTLLEVCIDCLGYGSMVVWWVSILAWHKYITHHHKRIQLWSSTLKLLFITTIFYILLYVTSNILAESTATTDSVPFSEYFNSVSQDVLFVELLHLAAESSHFFQVTIAQTPKENRESQPINSKQ